MLNYNGCIARFALTLGTVCWLAGCNWTTLASNNSAAEQGNGDSFDGLISDDGRYVAFESVASNLVDQDTNAAPDIFVRDTQTNVTTRVSVDSAGNQAIGTSSQPAISSNGRYVAFASDASNLLSMGTVAVADIFVHDRDTAQTTRVSVDSAGNGNGGNSISIEPSISDDGRYVAFRSLASNLVMDGASVLDSMFVRDRQLGVTSRVCVNSAGEAANSFCSYGSISGNGRYVVFGSAATNLVADDLNGQGDVFLRDTVANTTVRVSLDSLGGEANGASWESSISSDGRYVAFKSAASNLVAGDVGGREDIFFRDLIAGTTTRVSVNNGGVEADDHSSLPTISDDGRFVAFTSPATNLVPGDTNLTNDVFVHDRNTSATQRVSVDATGVQANGGSGGPSIAGQGRYVTYATSANNLVPDDLNGRLDIVVRSIPEIVVTSIFPDHLPIGSTTSVTITGFSFQAGAMPSVNGQLSNIVIIDENTITADVYVPPAKAPGAYDVVVNIFGTGPGFINGSSGACVGCVTFF